MMIRIAEQRDLPGILGIYAQPEMDNGDGLSIEEAQAILKKMATYPSYKVYVAERDGKVVGVFELLMMDNLAHQGRKSAIIEDVAVDVAYQGQGIGKEMMLFAMEVARKEQCYKIALSSNIRRYKAHQFYENLEFTVHGCSFVVEP